MKALTIRLDDEVHKLVKIRAARQGKAMEAIARDWFEQYANIERAGGLSAGEDTGGASGAAPAVEVKPGDRGAPGVPPAPAEKPCSRAARHHINHSGKPCPECGYPFPRDAS